MAAPLLARDAALVFQELQRPSISPPGTRIFAVTVKAYLALVAFRPAFPGKLETLAARTLGYGRTSVSRLITPKPEAAMFLWQGWIGNGADDVRVELFIPREWLRAAKLARLRISCATDTPANAAAKDTWAARKVELSLQAGPDGAIHKGRSGAKGAYPLFIRTYEFPGHSGEDAPKFDAWIVRLRYDRTNAEYAVARTFDPRQRVAFAAELLDVGEDPVSPQDFLQALPIAATMNSLSAALAPVGLPVTVTYSR